MNTAGRERNDDVAPFHRVFVQDLILVNYAEREAGEVIFVLRIEAGHFRGLTAGEHSTGLHTALSDAGDNRGNAFRIVLAAGNVVKENQRLCTDADNIVDAHGHTVNADCIVFVHEKCDF